MKPIVRNAILVATLIVLPGCPSQQVLMTPDDRLSLSSQPHIIAIHYPPEEIFRLRYPGEILGGPFVTLAAQYEAARLKRDLRLEDPALDVKDRLVNALRANFNITKVRTVSEYPHTNIAFETYMEARRAGSALDVETSRRMLDSTLKETLRCARARREENTASHDRRATGQPADEGRARGQRRQAAQGETARGG